MDKHQTMYTPAEEMKVYKHKYGYKYTYIY
jgi:hypothetical protein